MPFAVQSQSSVLFTYATHPEFSADISRINIPKLTNQKLLQRIFTSQYTTADTARAAGGKKLVLRTAHSENVAMESGLRTCLHYHSQVVRLKVHTATRQQLQGSDFKCSLACTSNIFIKAQCY